MLREFKQPAAVAVKHMNPCGIGLGDTLEAAWDKAYAADPMSIFGGIIALNRRVDQLLAQSYLFVGPKGAGKLALAEWIALRLFCQHVQDGAPCGECPECERILNHNHPDVMMLKTSTQSIKVDDIRNLKQEMSKTGVEGNQRVFIVEDADKMTAGAANSLLKFFEEPVPGMTVILTATAKNQLLPTITSGITNKNKAGRTQQPKPAIDSLGRVNCQHTKYP